jgi:hypothetical protein
VICRSQVWIELRSTLYKAARPPQVSRLCTQWKERIESGGLWIHFTCQAFFTTNIRERDQGSLHANFSGVNGTFILEEQHSLRTQQRRLAGRCSERDCICCERGRCGAEESFPIQTMGLRNMIDIRVCPFKTMHSRVNNRQKSTQWTKRPEPTRLHIHPINGHDRLDTTGQLACPCLRIHCIKIHR